MILGFFFQFAFISASFVPHSRVPIVSEMDVRKFYFNISDNFIIIKCLTDQSDPFYYRFPIRQIGSKVNIDDYVIDRIYSVISEKRSGYLEIYILKSEYFQDDLIRDLTNQLDFKARCRFGPMINYTEYHGDVKTLERQLAGRK